MRSRIKTLSVLVLLGGLALGALASSFLLESRSQIKPADVTSCAIYRSFYDHVDGAKDGRFFYPKTRPYNRTARRFYDSADVDKSEDSTAAWRDYVRRSRQFVPTRFERDTGQYKLVRSSTATKPVKKPIRETFEKDTSGFFEPLHASNPASLERCFDTSSDQPRFFGGSFKWLVTREQLLGRATDHWTVVRWTVSPAGFSKDGRHALLYAEYYCNALCAEGAFYLFEHRDGVWVVIGDNLIWVS